MAGREMDWDENGGSPDPESLYTKEFCIGSFCHMSAEAATGETQASDRHSLYRNIALTLS